MDEIIPNPDASFVNQPTYWFGYDCLDPDTSDVLAEQLFGLIRSTIYYTIYSHCGIKEIEDKVRGQEREGRERERERERRQ